MPSIRTTTAFPFGGSRLLLVLAVALLLLIAIAISIKQPGSILVSAFRFTQQHPHHRFQHRPFRSLSTPIPASSSASSASWYATQDENEDDWVTIKRKKEQEQQTWEAKIKAKNERKAAGKTQNGRNINRPPPPPSPQKVTTAVKDNNNNNNAVDDADTTTCAHYVSTEAVTFAEAYAAELIALSGPQFDDPRTNLGVGGLDDVIAEIKRRVWVPLAAPPSVMHELGITPVRGMILCK